MRTKGILFLLALCLTGAVVLAVTGFQGNPAWTTVLPVEIDDVLSNPGMGITTMTAFDGDVPGNPKSTIAYFRWYWEVIEPEEGVYKWEILDETLAKAKARGQRLAIGIMPANGRLGTPAWYAKTGAKIIEYNMEPKGGSPDDKRVMPDHNDPLFLKYYGRLTKAFGERYDGHPDIDHIDMRSFGHWGEWHFTNIKPTPTVKPENRRALVDIYLDNFKKTPLVMLIGGRDELAYAVASGTGWRADCLGDYGFWGDDWNHMRDSYQASIDYAKAWDTWKTALVTFESCGVMQTWVDKGYDIEQVFNEALRWHSSIWNNKSSPISPRWWNATERFLKKMGYRFVLNQITLPLAVKRGETLKLKSQWENVGVAPPYRGYIVAFKLRPMSRGRNAPESAARITADENLLKWLPGRHELNLDYQVPADMAPGRYHLCLALLDPFTKEAVVQLAIEGRDANNWYSLAEVEITE